MTMTPNFFLEKQAEFVMRERLMEAEHVRRAAQRQRPMNVSTRVHIAEALCALALRLDPTECRPVLSSRPSPGA
jgi:hypothetical protein